MDARIEVSWNTNFTMVPNEIWDIDLEMSERIIFMYLVKLKSNRREVAFPSYPVIAEACKIRNKNGEICKVKTRRSIDKMISIGLIKKLNRKKKNGEFTSNVYSLTHPSTLLKPVKLVDTEEEQFELVTPVSKPKSKGPSKPVKSMGCTVDTPVSNDVSTENIEINHHQKNENATYKDLLNNTYLKRKTTTSGHGGSLGGSSFGKKEIIKTLNSINYKVPEGTLKNLEKLGTTPERLVQVVNYAVSNNKGPGFVVKAIEMNYDLEPVKPRLNLSRPKVIKRIKDIANLIVNEFDTGICTDPIGKFNKLSEPYSLEFDTVVTEYRDKLSKCIGLYS
ncbi:hypothetical protein [Ilyobacter sp.]|uniref:hypothetical protein n=1 Tax=Ilyobacter sp. TaxID=3100343 RepID=UPI00356755A1